MKACRAWTYLQLVLNYGKVPLITTPILTKDDADRQYEMKDIQGICNYFASDIAPYANVETPDYGTIRGNDSKLFYFPIYVLMGDMNLWAGNYREAALCYYKYINSRNGSNSSYPIDKRTVSWSSSDSKWRMIEDGWSSDFQVESNSATSELITEIPGDSIPAEGNYSELKNLFSSSASNNYKVSIMPSVALRTLSQAQKYCHLNADKEVIYAPDNLNNNRKGDLRYLSAVSNYSGILGEDYVINSKYSSRNVHIYRRTMVYLRLAEALNRAGFPRFAFAILKTGVNNDVIENDILPYYPEEEAFLKQFDFPTSKYKLRTKSEGSDENTVGIHSKGSGWSEYNDFYVYPERDNMAEEQDAVEDLIVDEGALEFAYEGTRFYDLMRVALRRNNPAYLADKVFKGETGTSMDPDAKDVEGFNRFIERYQAGLSIERAMLNDAYDAFTGAANAVTGNLKVTNYSEVGLLKLCQTITAYNNGRKAVILGTPVALKSVLPSNSNYRYLLDSEYVKLGHLQTFNGKIYLIKVA